MLQIKLLPMGSWNQTHSSVHQSIMCQVRVDLALTCRPPALHTLSIRKASSRVLGWGLFHTVSKSERFPLKTAWFLSQKTEKNRGKPKATLTFWVVLKVNCVQPYTRKATRPPRTVSRVFSPFRQSLPYSCLVSSGRSPARLYPGDAVSESTSSKIAQYPLGPGLSHAVAELIQPWPSFTELLFED